MAQDIEHLEQTAWVANALYYEYMSAANPHIPPVPCLSYPSALHRNGATRLIPFDLSERLNNQSPATGPTVSAAYLRICQGESLPTEAVASAQLFYVIRGAGRSETPYGAIPWSEGDCFVLPSTDKVLHVAHEDSALYFINDAPLLTYLGAKPATARFQPTLYTRDRIVEELEHVDKEPGSHSRNRDAVILGNRQISLIKSATHTLWSAFVLVRPGEVQRPHRHNSIAVDIVIKAAPGCYTLLGSEVDDNGDILNPQRVDWESATAFVTPPGLWHGHYNESGESAMVMAAQEAGFYEYMRTLDIRFTQASTGREYKT
ncbi:MAG: hypothetical protein NTAFB01_42120 [Nitrospira sp.]